MRSRLLTLALLTTLTIPVSCSARHTTKLHCKGDAVSSAAQPQSATTQAAIDWYTSHLAAASGMPRSGYRRESGGSSRVVFVAADRRHRVTLVNTGTTAKPRWSADGIVIC